MRYLAAALIALIPMFLWPGAGAAATCHGFVDGKVYPPDVDRFYAMRAINIVRAGLANDQPTLSDLVLQEAKFEIWRGDYATSARQAGSGGLMEMVADLKPTGFQFATVRPGPISVEPSKCIWDVTILFRTEEQETGVTMEFDFLDGWLVRASGREVEITEGDIR